MKRTGRPGEARREFIVTIRVKSKNGNPPLVRTIGGDTVFCSMLEGMSATWTLKRCKPKGRIKR